MPKLSHHVRRSEPGTDDLVQAQHTVPGPRGRKMISNPGIVVCLIAGWGIASYDPYIA